MENGQLRGPIHTMEKDQEEEDIILYRLAAELISHLCDLAPEEER
jgi:hypothetical protein